MASILSLARTTIQASRSSIRSRAVTAGPSVLGRRHASFYNNDIAGLTEEQAEVRSIAVARMPISCSCDPRSSGTPSANSLRKRLRHEQQR